MLSRDPIGFEGSPWNLYEWVQGRALNDLDPSGEETIPFEFNAFINGKRGTWLPEPVISRFWAREFKTDGRRFGQRGTSRISTSGSIDSCAIGSSEPSASTSVGTSHMRRRIVSINPCGLFCGTISGPWAEFSDTASLDKDSVKGSVSDNPCKSTVRIEASAGYPFAPASPIIDYDVTFEFTVSGQDEVTVTFSGSNNRFPDYEAIVEFGSTRTPFYTYSSPDKGPGFGNLNSGVGGAGVAVIKVPTPKCSSSPEGSCGK